jgi:NADH dehydrogenase [ubiquinone] 1 alpha subcomplex assembly factor 7
MMVEDVPPLAAEIRRRIASAGPMPVSQFMDLCLSHPEHGYYMTRDPLGCAGDFITAPEISQMFGELIGLWAAEVWRLMGKPPAVRLVELGPGRGTLMLDVLRASKAVPEFRNVLTADLVETSPPLRQIQRNTLAGLDAPIQWHHTLADVPEAPSIIIANEFFDALPVNQVIRQSDGWHERVVELNADGSLAFALAAEPLLRFAQTLPAKVREAPPGTIYEWRSDHIILEISRRMLRAGGAALVIDYGHTRSAAGETLQAVRRHAYTDPLAAPGFADLTAHVDFEAIAFSAECIGARIHGPTEQATFLRRLGIESRAAALKAVAPPAVASKIDAAAARLTEAGSTGMGTMFKAMGLTHPAFEQLPGFDSAT